MGEHDKHRLLPILAQICEQFGIDNLDALLKKGKWLPRSCNNFEGGITQVLVKVFTGCLNGSVRPIGEGLFEVLFNVFTAIAKHMLQ